MELRPTDGPRSLVLAPGCRPGREGHRVNNSNYAQALERNWFLKVSNETQSRVLLSRMFLCSAKSNHLNSEKTRRKRTQADRCSPRGRLLRFRFKKSQTISDGVCHVDVLCHQSLRHVHPKTAVTSPNHPFPPAQPLVVLVKPPGSHGPAPHIFHLTVFWFFFGGGCSPHFFFPSISASAQRRKEGVFIYKAVCLLLLLSFFLFFQLLQHFSCLLFFLWVPTGQSPKFFRI